MSETTTHNFQLPPEQQAIRAKCFHPSGTFVEFPIEDVETSIPARFEKMVRMYPNHLAFKIVDKAATYAEINALANQFAHELVDKLGLGSEPVGILLENGVELLAATFGVLKAGKFVVSVDPYFPKERAKAIFDESQTRLIITDATNVTAARALSAKAASLTGGSIGPTVSAENINLSIPATSPAFLICTSGSTGIPKSVIHNHRSRLYGVMERANAFHLSQNDNVSLLSSGTANSIGNSLRTLLTGASLHAFDLKKYGIATLAKWLSEEKITVCSISASLFREFCKTRTGQESFRDLRILGLRSESVWKTDVELYKKYFPPSCFLVNGISVSEAGLLAMYFLDHQREVCGNEVPVGYAVKDKEISLIDDDGKDVGFNRVGEIVVRSKYLFPGYWKNPDLTTAKFKPDPQDPEKRIYCTGDLALMLPDGCLIHKGRKDFRLKIRGYGVDVVEAENSLRGHPAVKDAVVVARQNETAETQLVAYFTSLTQQGPTTSELRQYLRKILADYMIPSAFIRLDVLPLTPNGKVDRRALPDADSRRPELDTPFVAPRTDLENTVARIVSECTGIEPVGIEDNFFDLGGDSLSLTRLMTRLSATFGREIPIRDMFESTSVAGIARLLEATAGSSSTMNEPALCSMATNLPLELSFSQQRLWFLDQLRPLDPAYNLLSAFQITGNLNITALERSLNEIVARHEVLRTVFDSEDGRPRLKLLPSSALAIRVIDLEETFSPLENDVLLKQQCAALVRQPFDLSHDSLLSISLLRQCDDRHVLVIVAHHIVFDGWSMGLLWNELAVCYEAFCEGKQVRLAKLPVQYADFSHWQRDRLQHGLLQNQSEYWRQQLDGISRLQLSSDRPLPVNQSSNGAKRYFVLSVGLSAKLKRLSRDHGATLFMTLLAAFQTLLHRYTAQADIAIGCPVAGRNRSEVENLIGFFLNILVFRVDISSKPSFGQLLDRVRRVCLAAYAHQDLPFEKLVEELHPERHLNRNPLVDVMFAFQNTPYVAPQLYGTTVSQLEIDNGISRFDLQLFMEETGGQLRGHFTYSTDLFDEPTIAGMAEHFLNLLDAVVTNPERPVGQLPLLTEAEKHQLTVKWNQSKRDYPKDKRLHQLFEQQSERSPEAVAVVFEDQQLTYQELNNRSNQVAHYLRKLGVGPNVFVGICLERSLEMVVALLGVLKAGGAYLPLDSSYPEARLGYMLKDTGARMLLTLQELSRRLPEYGGQTICLDREWQEICGESATNLPNETDENDIAYVIYTSGSTGTPKGVMIPHSAICNHMMWMLEAFPLGQDDRVAQRTPLNFDASVWEVFAPLISGAQLVLARPEASRDAENLVHLLQKERITVLQVVPTLLELLLEENMAQCTSLRRVFCGGEPWSADLYARFRRQLAVPLINLYGPTEAAIDATSYVCSEDHSSGWMPIGRPIANTQIYVLDRYLAPVPIGVAGEICIGGAGLARGYLNQPELTEEKFIYHSFNGEPVRRLYKTGDLGRYLPDGNIEFLGRMDHQVKIRGYRIEPGEIETVLGQHSSVQSSAVMVREDTSGDKRLVAYVVAQPQASFDLSEMRKYLKQKLPEYMIPSALVALDELPLTPNGKVDRRALPMPDQNRPDLVDAYQAPRTPLEDTLARIWAELLKVDKVGIRDNFFDLGGHSLLATQIVSRVRSCLSTELPLRTLFESPTIEQMAGAVYEAQGKAISDGGDRMRSGLIEPAVGRRCKAASGR